MFLSHACNLFLILFQGMQQYFLVVPLNQGKGIPDLCFNPDKIIFSDSFTMFLTTKNIKIISFYICISG